MLLIHCPACHGTLEVDAAQLTRPRRICCTLCTHRWIEEPRTVAQPVAIPPRPSASEPLPVAPSPVRSEQPISVSEPQGPQSKELRFGRRRLPIPSAQPLPEPRSYGLLSSVAILAIIALLLGGRETVVRYWAPAAHAFAALGLPVNLHGLEIRDVRTRIVQEPTQKVLTIDGQIRNLRDGSQALPELLLSLRDQQGREVYAWKAPTPKSGLTRGEAIQFRARLAAPPDGANIVRVQFAEPTTTRMAAR
mgnify:CR=1 FL=1